MDNMIIGILLVIMCLVELAIAIWALSWMFKIIKLLRKLTKARALKVPERGWYVDPKTHKHYLLRC